MKLYNSLSSSLSDFKPASNTVKIYSCGPTVYNNLHIGNLSSFVYADLLRRIIANNFPEVEIIHVMNITDVDDKTIRDSKDFSDSPMNSLLAFTKKYEQIFMDDMSRVGNDLAAMQFIRATDSITEMLEFIRELYDQGFAYIADDGVYFSIEKYKQSGKKYGQLVHIDESNTSSSRIQNDEYDKESAHDFALWKVSKSGEPFWEFDLAGTKLDGRPGWHIECSAMSRKLLGQPFDIHTGGIDLKFPHHENELAQSTATSKEELMAKFFIHNEHVLVDGKKMSKSLNNFYTLRDLEDKGFDPLVFRMLVMQGHYRNSVSFSWENLLAAREELQSFKRIAALRWQTILPQNNEVVAGSVVDQLLKGIVSICGTDMKIPAALTYINELRSMADMYIKENLLDHEDLTQLNAFFSIVDKILGLKILDTTPDLNPNQKKLLSERKKSRENSDFTKSDALRDQLKEQGVAVLDTPSGQIWHYI